jgi:hypothetical protein
MPSLSFFIDEHDVGLLVERLNADPEIAFIVPDDPAGGPFKPFFGLSGAVRTA